jgi:hypothetical protein
MRFFSSKISLVVISFFFISALFWIIAGNFNVFSPIFSSQANGNSAEASLDNVKAYFFGFTKWVFETSKPIASELGTSVQSWWETQKVIIVDQLINWLSQQQSDISAALQSRLREITSHAVGMH